MLAGIARPHGNIQLGSWPDSGKQHGMFRMSVSSPSFEERFKDHPRRGGIELEAALLLRTPKCTQLERSMRVCESHDGGTRTEGIA